MLRKRGKYWHVQLKVNGKPWSRSTGETDKRRAEAKVAELERLAELHREQPSDCLKLKAAIVKEVDLAESDVSQAESDRVSDGLENFFSFIGHDILLEQITADVLEDYQRHRLKKASLATYNREMNYIVRMLKRYGFMVAKPKAKRGKKVKHRPFTSEELKKFFAHSGPNRMLFMTMLVTGARPAELVPSDRSSHVALLKEEIDQANCTIIIRNAKLKTGQEEKVRLVKVPEEFMQEMVAFARTVPGNHVFPVRNGSLHTTFDRILKYAGIAKVNALGKKLTAHSFRHTYCTLMAKSVGHNPFVLMSMMGHAQITTSQIYCHAVVSAEVIDTSFLREVDVKDGCQEQRAMATQVS